MITMRGIIKRGVVTTVADSTGIKVLLSENIESKFKATFKHQMDL